MSTKELYERLINAYSDKNLNTITGKLIELYQAGSHRQIRELVNKISDFVKIDEEKDARCFSKLIRLYHPDKGESYRNSIKNLYLAKNHSELKEYTHILLLDEIEKIEVAVLDDDIGYCPEYMWDSPPTSGFHYFTEGDEEYHDITEVTSTFDNSFFSAVKLRMYGDLNIDMPPYYLEDFDEIEMAESQIESLDGIEYCKHAVNIDLSGNFITDISDLVYLKKAEELYLANNQICLIDVLHFLKRLRILDLTGNQVDDISSLLNLENLEYVNLIGNRVAEKDIELLSSKGVLVMS